MRVSSATSPSLMGTLKSTRTSTRLSRTSRSLTLRLLMAPPFGRRGTPASQALSTRRLRLRFQHFSYCRPDKLKAVEDGVLTRRLPRRRADKLPQGSVLTGSLEPVTYVLHQVH